MIDLKQIVVDETIYPRSAISDFNVNRLIAAMRTGVKLPPLIVEAKTNRLVDGWHRREVYLREKIDRCEVISKVYASEADLFADAVRCNISHGEPLDQYTVRNAIIRLTDYGYRKDQISDVVRLPVDAIEKIERGFASEAETGRPIALKGGLGHLAGQALTADQRAVNHRYSGQKATFYANQIAALLENDIWHDTPAFVGAMNRLVELWTNIRAHAA
jgi:hypothetical protein